MKPDRTLVGMPSLRAVKSFIAAGKYGSFTRAAESLCVTQAAISRQVRELEAVLGVELFKRKGRAIELTEAGRVLFDTAYLSFVNISQAAERIKTDQTNRRALRVCVSPAFSSLWLAPRLHQFFEKHPDAAINILMADEITGFEPNNKPDAFISMNMAYGEGYNSVKLFDEKIYPVCGSHFLQRHPEICRLEGLRASTLLELGPFRMSQISEHVDWDFWFFLAGAPPAVQQGLPNPSCRTNDYNILLQMAINQQGIALGWDHLVRPFVDDGRLVKPVEREVELKEKSHYLYYDVKIAEDETFRAFKDWLLSYF